VAVAHLIHPSPTNTIEGVRDDSRPTRIALVIAAPTFARNFVASGVLRSVASDVQVEIIAAAPVVEQCPWLADETGYRGAFAVDPARDRRHYFLFSVLMWRHRHLTGAFRLRAQRQLGFEHLHLAFAPGGRGRRTRALGRFLRQLLRPGTLGMLVLGTKPVAGPFATQYARWRLPVNPHLDRLVADVDPDVIVFPSSAYDPVGNDVTRIGAARHVPTLFLIDNWDNLSSKSLFWTWPDHVGVWGPQSRHHAEEIQGFAPERVHEVGTPRFESYRRARDDRPRAPIDGRYALFLGCALPFDEIAALRVVDAELTAHPDRYGDLTVVYRPHPSQQQRLTPGTFDESSFAHVVLDPQMRDLVGVRDALPDLDWYGPLLANAEIVMGPLTTMLVEALIFNKPIVAIAYDDGVHLTSPSRALDAYPHFEGIEDIEQLTLCRSERDLPALLRRAVTSPPTTPQGRTDEQLAHFVELDFGGYGARVVDLVEKIAAGGSW
jgi:hypothetical protein